MSQVSALSAGAKKELKPLRPIERQVLELVLRGMKPTEAVRTLLPSAKRPDVIASKMLAKENVKAERQRMEDNALETANVSRTWIVSELYKLAKANLFDEAGKLKDFDQLDPDTQAAVASVEVETVAPDRQLHLFDGTSLTPAFGKVERVRKLKLWDKKGALETLASIARLKDAEKDTDLVRVGPGLTVVVQQVQGGSVAPQGAQGPALHSAQRVVVNLPPPPPR